MKKELNLISSIAIAVLFFTIQVTAQISPPKVGGGISFDDELCVTSNSPNREALASSDRTTDFPIGTEFILEISEPDGTFPSENIRQLTRFVSGTAVAPGGDIRFSFRVPSDLSSDDYRLRVRYIEPNGNENIGRTNNRVAIHFLDLSEDPDGLIIRGPNPNANIVALCEGESATLNVSITTLNNYEWFLDDELVGTGTTLENVTEEGVYTVTASYGQCDRRFTRNSDNITVVNFNKTTVTIDGPSTQEYCPSDVKILTCSIVDSGLIYEWRKDDEILEGETEASIILPESNFEGAYTVTVRGTSTCSEESNPVQVNNLGSDITSRPPPELIFLPSQSSILLEIETNAPLTSTVEWFVDNVSQGTPTPISDAGALSFLVTNRPLVSNATEYRAEIATDDVCMDILEVRTLVFAAVEISLEIANILNCDDNALSSLALENLFGVNIDGNPIPLTTDQYAFFDFEWFRNDTATGITDTTIAVDANDVGQTYVLNATIRDGSFPTASSPALVVEFLDAVVQIEVDPPVLPDGGTVILTAPQSANYSYQWFFNDEIIPGEISNSIEVDTEGEYYVEITLSECVVTSERVTVSSTVPPGVSEIIPNIVTPNNDGINDSWLLPESMVNQQDVEVTIYDARGQVDFMGSNYQNNWPLENSRSSGQNPIYYYIITRNNSVVRKGSITVMR
ncbi:gliding motility-associated C-terminal domain-containing protein [Aquimarina sp. U1-2]|uniref:T9SS type B sorting domain-containing protein n=1 Tax=Aquimarina sp. U1-2 TaxID=2823141 RepID=UPI001AECFFFF|nr:gliding motility-associated C-terminal domain-containing protein [Aquimarina sp. U1-2]MBP2833840.1 gliding motility-associated C-terminal domain-containing protein [Aquimarina sp. U1-2]